MDFTYHLVMTFTVRHGRAMALIEIDASPINSMVDLSMAMFNKQWEMQAFLVAQAGMKPASQSFASGLM